MEILCRGLSVAALRGSSLKTKRKQTMKYLKVKSPVGMLKLVASEKGLRAILWENDEPARVKSVAGAKESKSDPLLLDAEKQLRDYFSGKRTRFSIPFDMIGTSFQIKVWQALLEIPFGETRSYGEIAKRIRRPKASRAV